MIPVKKLKESIKANHRVALELAITKTSGICTKNSQAVKKAVVALGEKVVKSKVVANK